MSTSTTRFPNLLILSAFAALAANGASANTGGYSEFSATSEMADARREELSFLSSTDPFPKTVAALDPITKTKLARVLLGPAFRTRAVGSDFDYYRYVTFYDIETRKERIYALPIQQEECHDRSEAFASYAYSYTFSASLSASASVEGLGLSTSITESRNFSTSRNLRATGDMLAEHTPYFLKQDWVGRTFIQTYDSKTGKIAFVTKEQKASSWLTTLLFPILAHSAYPMPFKVRDADWTFLVERVVTGSCDPGFGQSAADVGFGAEDEQHTSILINGRAKL